MRIFSFLRLFLTSCLIMLALANAAQAAPLDRIIAVINSDVITYSELQQRVALSLAQLRRQNIQPPPTSQLESQMLDRMVTERLQLQEAKNTNINIDDATLQRALQTIASNNKMSLDQLRGAVEKQEGIPWSRFREDIRNEITLSRLRDRDVNSKVTVSDAEVDAFLNSAEGMSKGREYLVSHILLRAADGTTPEQWAALQKRADEAIRLANQGEDFAKLAAAFSDAQDAMHGGSLDWQPIERLPSIFADQVSNLKSGQIVGPLRSTAGLHIFKLIDIRDQQQPVKKIEQTHARHILVRTSDVVSSEDAQHRLNDLRDRIMNGAEFGELARVNSADTGSGAKGGDLGWVSPGDTVPDFEKAMNALKPGEISQPIQSPFGWHLIQVLERRSVDVSNDQRRNQALEALRNRKSDEAYEDWLRQLRDSAYVEIRLNDR